MSGIVYVSRIAKFYVQQERERDQKPTNWRGYSIIYPQCETVVMNMRLDNNISVVNKDWNKNDKLEDVLEKQVFVIMPTIQVMIFSHLVNMQLSRIRLQMLVS